MKQFSKFKQFADKAFVRPDRTEVMSEDMLEADKHIELMKLTCETTMKKMAACVQIPSQTKEGTTIARRIKKVPEYALGSSMDELGKKLDQEGSVLGLILGEAGKIEMTIGTQMLAHEGKIEAIIGDLQKLVDNEFPTIAKLKRTLTKLSEHMDSAKAKLQQANRHSMSAATGGKIDNCKDELEEIQLKVEQCRDNLASEMYSLLARESDISHSIVQFLRFQQEYHQTIANTLSNLLPEVDAALANSSNKPVYGVDLGDHLSSSGRTIAYPIELCVCGLLETALTEEGLFRIAGSSSKVKKLKSAFNAWLVDLKGLMGEFSDPHVIGNALKCYLRELPNPLLTLELYSEWIDAIRISDNQEKLQALWNVIHKLPAGNRENLRYLIKFFAKLSYHQDVNKMSAANIAIVLGPNLLWSPPAPDDGLGGDSTPMGLNMAMTHWFSSIVEQLVTNADWFFPGDIEFFVTCERPEPEWVPVHLRVLPGQLPVMPNGGTAISEDDDNQLKRSQSNSSLDEHIGNGSPKPVIRRKGKPAPLPPTTKTSAETSVQSISTQNTESKTTIPVQSQQSKISTKREGIWIPPSPSQMKTNATTTNNPNPRASFFNQNPQPPKVVPPKPPQPTFSKEKSSSTVDNTPESATLRHKSSFRSPNKIGSEEGASSLQYNSSSLPRHFHTENSYKNNQSSSKTPSVFTIKSETLPEPQQPHISPIAPIGPEIGKKEESALKSTDKIEPVQKDEDSTSKIEKEESIQKVEKPQPKIEKKESGGGVTKVDATPQLQQKAIGFEAIEAEVKVATSPTTDHPRPVPAPRSSLLKDLNTIESKLQSALNTSNPRPAVKAKPRDLERRAQDREIQQHSRNSSGDSDEILSSPSSRTHSRTDERGSIPSEDELGNDGNFKNSKMPYRPPRPQPPPPPKGKESTDL